MNCSFKNIGLWILVTINFKLSSITPLTKKKYWRSYNYLEDKDCLEQTLPHNESLIRTCQMNKWMNRWIFYVLPIGSWTSYSPWCVLTNEETITRASNVFLPCWGIFDWLDKRRKYKQSELTEVQIAKACLCIKRKWILKILSFLVLPKVLAHSATKV